MRHRLWRLAPRARRRSTRFRRPRVRRFAATVLGTDYDGVLVRDGWAPYRRSTHALHQTCLTVRPDPASAAGPNRSSAQPVGRPGASRPAGRSPAARLRRDAGLLSATAWQPLAADCSPNCGRLTSTKRRRWTPPTASPPIWTAIFPAAFAFRGTRRRRRNPARRTGAGARPVSSPAQRCGGNRLPAIGAQHPAGSPAATVAHRPGEGRQPADPARPPRRVTLLELFTAASFPPIPVAFHVDQRGSFPPKPRQVEPQPLRCSRSCGSLRKIAASCFVRARSRHPGKQRLARKCFGDWRDHRPSSGHRRSCFQSRQ